MAVIIIRGRSANVYKESRSTLEPKATAVVAEHQQILAVTVSDKVEKRESVSSIKDPG